MKDIPKMQTSKMPSILERDFTLIQMFQFQSIWDQILLSLLLVFKIYGPFISMSQNVIVFHSLMSLHILMPYSFAFVFTEKKDDFFCIEENVHWLLHAYMMKKWNEGPNQKLVQRLIWSLFGFICKSFITYYGFGPLLWPN